jgi:anaerobic ribonucleoside-triphosphate reductase
VQLDDGSVHQLCEQYQRVMGYFRPVNAWNPGKQQEHRDRTFFVERKAQDHA